MNRSSSKQRSEEKYLFFFPLHPTWWTLVPRRPTLCLWNGSRVLRFVPEYCQKAPKGITFGQNPPLQGKHILIFKIFERRPILYKNLTTPTNYSWTYQEQWAGGLFLQLKAYEMFRHLRQVTMAITFVQKFSATWIVWRCPAHVAFAAGGRKVPLRTFPALEPHIGDWASLLQSYSEQYHYHHHYDFVIIIYLNVMLLLVYSQRDLYYCHCWTAFFVQPPLSIVLRLARLHFSRSFWCFGLELNIDLVILPVLCILVYQYNQCYTDYQLGLTVWNSIWDTQMSPAIWICHCLLVFA